MPISIMPITRGKQFPGRRSGGADALRKIWPSIGNRYDKYKRVFGMASAYRIDSLDIAADGQQAIVNASLSQEYTVRGQKPMSHNDKAVFHLVKSDGVWVINDVQ